MAEASLELKNILNEISIIIPIAPADLMWNSLVKELLSENLFHEIILVFSKPETENSQSTNDSILNHPKLIWIYTEKGRANQLNCGAIFAKGKFLWFLHADSRLSKNISLSLANSLSQNHNNIHYFDLNFYECSSLMSINAAGVWFRSHCLKLPFGDQGFCLDKKLFFQLKGYPTETLYGEDHLFIWKAKRKKIKLRPVNSILYTSARKYKKQGWFITTLQTLYLTWKQALPEWYKLIKTKSII